MKYWYYVSYSFTDKNGRTGFSGATINREFPIDSDIHISDITTALTAHSNLRTVAIISWNLLRIDE